MFTAPENDAVVFRRILGHHPSFTAALLNDLLDRQGDQRIVSLSLLSPEQAPGADGGKQSVLNLEARDQAGRTFFVELHPEHLSGFLDLLRIHRRTFDEFEQVRGLADEAARKGEARGREQGLGEGRRQGLRAATEDLAELLGLPVDEARRSALSQLDLTGLESLRTHLKRHRTWPG